jgi:type VI secretion system protein ImpM
MGFGLFGKLPQKRDFVALGIPRGLLEPFETWLQSAVAASRNELGGQWQDQYLVAPIWRFWIGPAIFGTTCAGALIPSVDGVGRFFPLTILYSADEGSVLPPPSFAPLDEWYAAIETRLLSVLDPEAAIEVDKLTQGLAAPMAEAAPPEPAGTAFRKGIVWQSQGGAVNELLGSIAQADYRDAADGRSFWWTNGSASKGSLVYVRNSLPDPFFFTSMVKGDTN